MTLLERSDFVQTLTDYLGEADGGDSRLVLLYGEAGVGKTAVVEAVQALSPNSRWLWSACDGASTPQPLGPLFDLADQLGDPLLSASRSDATAHQLMRLLLDEISAGPTTVVVIEDIHWADEATLDLLRFLARRLRQRNVMLIVTYRDDGLADDDPLRVALGELSTQRLTRRMNLPPLSRAAVKEMAAGTRVVPDELYRLTAGNPFYVTEVLHSANDEVPPSAQEAVLSRLAGLSSEAREIVETVAIIGNRVTLDSLRQAIDAPSATIDECLMAGVLVSDANGFGFRHELARLAVVNALPQHRCVDLHAEALSCLEESGSDDGARLAHHAEGSLNRDAVLRYAPAAAERAASLSAHRESAAQYERALRFAKDLPLEEQATLYDALATQTSLFDQWGRSAAARESALALWREVGNPLREGSSLCWLSRAYWRLTRGDEADVAAEQALAILEELAPSRELAWALAMLAATRMRHGEFTSALPLSLAAQELAEQFDEPAILSDALNTQACSMTIKTDEDQEAAADLLRQAIRIATTNEADDQAGRAYANLHEIFVRRYHLAEVPKIFEEGVEYCVEMDVDTFAACLRGEHVQYLEKVGRWDEAESQSASLLETAPSPINQINPCLALVLVRMRRGQRDAAALLDTAMAMAVDTGEAQWIIYPQLCAIELAWLNGDFEAAVARTRIAAQTALLTDEWDRGAVAAWAHRLGIEDLEMPGVARPYALEVSGDWSGAADAWHAIGTPYLEGLALLGSGDESALREAHRIFDDLGAAPAAAKARAALRDLGVNAIPRGPRDDTRADPYGLTPREREVLDLLREEQSNAEIAARLVISEKTVGHHVSAVLAKLGVPSRREAARVANETQFASSAR